MWENILKINDLWEDVKNAPKDDRVYFGDQLKHIQDLRMESKTTAPEFIRQYREKQKLTGLNHNISEEDMIFLSDMLRFNLTAGELRTKRQKYSTRYRDSWNFIYNWKYSELEPKKAIILIGNLAKHSTRVSKDIESKVENWNFKGIPWSVSIEDNWPKTKYELSMNLMYDFHSYLYEENMKFNKEIVLMAELLGMEYDEWEAI